jgi:hypothetical protein
VLSRRKRKFERKYTKEKATRRRGGAGGPEVDVETPLGCLNNFSAMNASLVWYQKWLIFISNSVMWSNPSGNPLPWNVATWDNQSATKPQPGNDILLMSSQDRMGNFTDFILSILKKKIELLHGDNKCLIRIDTKDLIIRPRKALYYQ